MYNSNSRHKTHFLKLISYTRSSQTNRSLASEFPYLSNFDQVSTMDCDFFYSNISSQQQPMADVLVL